MKKVTFNADDISKENIRAAGALANITEYVKPINSFSKEQQKQAAKIVSMRDKLRDLRNESDYSISTSDRANDISNKIK